MQSLVLSSLRKSNDFGFSENMDFEADSKQLFDEIDELSVCCSTPTNRVLSFNFSRGLQDQLFDCKYDSPHEIQLHKFCNSFDEVEINKKTERTEVDHQPRTVVESSSSSMISNNSQSLKVFTIEKIQKFSKVKDFSNRQDVINKAALRKMRKYYSDMFKSANKKLVRLRFCNSKSSEIMRAAKSILKNEFGEEADIDELCYYLIGILKIKSLCRIHCNENIKQEVNQYLDCVRNYSKNKFDKIFKSESLKLNSHLYKF